MILVCLFCCYDIELIQCNKTKVELKGGGLHNSLVEKDTQMSIRNETKQFKKPNTQKVLNRHPWFINNTVKSIGKREFKFRTNDYYQKQQYKKYSMFHIKPQTPTFGDKKQIRKPLVQYGEEKTNNTRVNSMPTRQTNAQSRSTSNRKKTDQMIKKWKELYDEQTNYYLRLLKVNNINNIELPKFQLQK